MPAVDLRLDAADNLPMTVHARMSELVENSMQAAFKQIADDMEALGYPVTGDIAPWELPQLEEAFQLFVRTMALNNVNISEMQR